MKISSIISRRKLVQLIAPTLSLILLNPTPGSAQPVYQTVRTFGFPDLSSAAPVGSLVEGTNGALYGLSLTGGQAGQGTLFRLNKDGTGFAVLRSFSGTNGDGSAPWTGLLLATNGVLYGTTSSGGYSNAGTIFRIDQDGNNYAVIKSFTGSDGSTPARPLMQAGNGMLYGTTGSGGGNNVGTLFSIALDGSGYAVRKSFAGGASDGASPSGPLVQGTNGLLFGTTSFGGTSNRGTVFSINLDGNGFTLLRSFTGTNGDGSGPASLLLAGNGVFYGTTANGGYTNVGTLFRIDQDGGNYSVIMPSVGAALMQASNGMIYATTSFGGVYANGSIFQISPDGTGYKILKSFLPGQDGFTPSGPLVQGSDGLLYGTTPGGGIGSEAGTTRGTAFAIGLDGGGFTVILTFSPTGKDGVAPQAPLLLATNGSLYGTTPSGGSYAQGAVFKINPDGSGYALLRSFTGTNGNPALPDGASPGAGLMQGSDGELYGTTMYDYYSEGYNFGFVSGNGTVFKLNLDGTGYQIIKRFSGGSDGANPSGRLIQANDGLLYGTTMYGGTGGGNGLGVIFRLNMSGTGYVVLTNFSTTLGYQSMAGLLQASDGALYGTTTSGGSGGKGTIFRLNLDGSGYKVLRGVSGSTGASPWRAPLIQGFDGLLYGTTMLGGNYDLGTVFRLNLDGSGFAVLKHFSGSKGDGKWPQSALLQVNNGILYGTTALGGTNDYGTVFQINPDGSGFGVLHRFDVAAQPGAGLIQTADGTLFGTTSILPGTIFSLVPPTIMLPPSPGETGWHISFLGCSGRNYTVQRATALSGPWAPLGPVFVGGSGVGSLDDPNPQANAAFYRTASP